MPKLNEYRIRHIAARTNRSYSVAMRVYTTLYPQENTKGKVRKLTHEQYKRCCDYILASDTPNTEDEENIGNTVENNIGLDAQMAELKAQMDICNTVLKPLVREITVVLNPGSSEADIQTHQGGVWSYLYRCLGSRYGIDVKAIHNNYETLTGNYVPRKIQIVSTIMCIPLLVEIAQGWLSSLKRKNGHRSTENYVNHNKL